jgi:transcriptional regulator with XRE-family HTH domain
MKTAIEKIFGEVLREFRLAKQFTQSELAEKSSLDRTFISLLERGSRQPTISTLFKLAAALDLSMVSIIQEVERRVNENSQNSLSDQR